MGGGGKEIILAKPGFGICWGQFDPLGVCFFHMSTAHFTVSASNMMVSNEINTSSHSKLSLFGS